MSNTKLSPNAINLLKRVREQILKEPKKYDQGRFGSICETSYCIAGHLCMAVDGHIPATLTERVSARAQSILGITSEQADELFYAAVYSRKATKEQTPNDSERAEYGAKHLNEFISRHS
jgi:hypothetical protein